MSKLPDELGDRMKSYEAVEAKRRLDVHLPICARIDGRTFSSFTRGFEKPFDPIISGAMKQVCRRLVDETHAKLGFVQSDEISLIWEAEEGSSIIFDGRVQKMASILASIATSEFTLAMQVSNPDLIAGRKPVFDCRVWQVPSRVEAANVIVWRSQDARKNSISSACRSVLSAKKMHGLDQLAMLEAMQEKGLDFHATFSDEDKYGVYYKRVTRPREIDDETWAKIPDNKKPESRIVMRSAVEKITIGYFGDVINRTAFIFESEEPQFHDEKEH